MAPDSFPTNNVHDRGFFIGYTTIRRKTPPLFSFGSKKDVKTALMVSHAVFVGGLRKRTGHSWSCGNAFLDSGASFPDYSRDPLTDARENPYTRYTREFDRHHGADPDADRSFPDPYRNPHPYPGRPGHAPNRGTTHRPHVEHPLPGFRPAVHQPASLAHRRHHAHHD